MNDSTYNKLLETSLRRPLTPDEEARLHAYFEEHPEARNQWEDEAFLTRQLRQLPDAPLSSNFTALVMQAVDAETARPRPAIQGSGWVAWLLRHLPQTAMAVLLLLLGGTGYHLLGQLARAQVAKSVVKVAEVAPVAQADIFEDFDAIHQLSQVSKVSDEDLLAALQ